jgi:hypothetical protein
MPIREMHAHRSSYKPLTERLSAGLCNHVESCKMFRDRGKQCWPRQSSQDASYTRWFAGIAPQMEMQG